MEAGREAEVQMHGQTPWQHILVAAHIHISETTLSNRVPLLHLCIF